MRLPIAVIFSVLWFSVVNTVHAAGRVFYCDFESTPSACGFSGGASAASVDAASDGKALLSGKAGRIEWDGVGGGFDGLFKALDLGVARYPHNKELFLRYRYRYDDNYDRVSGGKHMRVGFCTYIQADISDSPPTMMHEGWLSNIGDNTCPTWIRAGTDKFDPRANQYCETNNPLTWTGCKTATLNLNGWHKLELYVYMDSTAGIIRRWHDDVEAYKIINANTALGGTSGGVNNEGTWGVFHFGTNWSKHSNWMHDAVNYMYLDNVEFYSDTGTGGGGVLANGNPGVGGPETEIPPTATPTPTPTVTATPTPVTGSPTWIKSNQNAVWQATNSVTLSGLVSGQTLTLDTAAWKTSSAPSISVSSAPALTWTQRANRWTTATGRAVYVHTAVVPSGVSSVTATASYGESLSNTNVLSAWSNVDASVLDGAPVYLEVATASTTHMPASITTAYPDAMRALFTWGGSPTVSVGSGCTQDQVWTDGGNAKTLGTAYKYVAAGTAATCSVTLGSAQTGTAVLYALKPTQSGTPTPTPSTTPPPGTNYYVAPAGNDTTGTGTVGAPWKTLSKACTAVTGPAIINLAAGTYTETVYCDLKPGVSIKGAGKASTIINTSGLTDELIYGFSTAAIPAVLGNHDISGFTIVGNNRQLKKGINIRERSNVVIHDVEIKDVLWFGLDVSSDTTPGTSQTWLTGVNIYNVVMSNCSSVLGTFSTGCLQVGSLQGGLVHDNTINDQNAQGIKFSGVEGHFRNSKVYNNYIRVPATNALPDNSGLSIELWNCDQDSEIYNNDVNMWISVEFSQKRSGTWGCEIHDNVINIPTANEREGIEIADGGDAYIHDNRINNAMYGIAVWGAATSNNVLITRNHIVGRADGNGVRLHAAAGTKIWNNSFSGMNTGVYLFKAAGREVTNIDLTNNVFHNVQRPLVLNSETAAIHITGTIAKNNIFNGTGPFYTNDGFAPGDTISATGTINNDPQVTVSSVNYNILPNSSTSRIIDAGFNTGVTFCGTAVDIGAFEYCPATPTPSSTPTPTVTPTGTPTTTPGPTPTPTRRRRSVQSTLPPPPQAFNTEIRCPLNKQAGTKSQCDVSTDYSRPHVDRKPLKTFVDCDLSKLNAIKCQQITK